MAETISDIGMLRASRKANRGVLDPATIDEYANVMQSGAEGDTPTVTAQDDMNDFAQQSFNRKGVASQGVQSDTQMGTEDEGFGSNDDTDLASEEFEEADDAEDEVDKVAMRQAAQARVKAMGIVERLIYWADPVSPPNIAYELDDGKLGAIGMLVVEETSIDEISRAEWLDAAEAGMKLALQKAVPKSYPWENASNVIFPLMTQAADQFAARAYPAIIKDRNVVRGLVIGDDSGVPANPQQSQMPDAMAAMLGHNGGPPASEWAVPPGEKTARAQRIGDHMSYQILEGMPEWEEETDKLLSILPIVGCHFRKTFRDFEEGRNVSAAIMAVNLIINYRAKSLETAPRITEVLRLYPHEIQEHINSGFFLDKNYSASAQDMNDPDAPIEFLEQHRRLDLDDDGYTEPYIVTVHRDTGAVARIVARWDAKEGLKRVPGTTDEVAMIKPLHYYTKYDFLPNKEGGIYGYGFSHVLRSTNEAVNATLNMLIDAGHLQNAGGGFIGKGLSMMTGNVRMTPGEWKVVNAAGQDIARSIVPLKFDGPSPVLFQLLGMLIDAGREISSVKDVLTGEVKAQTMSPTVFMALVEQGLKIFTAIYKRVFRALKSEFQKLYRLNKIYLGDSDSYLSGGEWRTVSKQDYIDGAGVAPVSDPSMVVDAQKMARVNVPAQFKDDPLLNGKEIRRRIIEASGVEDGEKILAVEPAPNPELMARMAEIEIKKIAAKAQVLVNISQAIRNMADADAAVTAPFNQWVALQMQQVKNEYEHLAEQPGSESPDAGGSPAGNQGVDPGGMGAMAAPSGVESAPPLPFGLSGANPA